MPAQPRERRRSSTSGPSEAHRSERREKARSSQQTYNTDREARRGSIKSPQTERFPSGSRATSGSYFPSAARLHEQGRAGSREKLDHASYRGLTSVVPSSPLSPLSPRTIDSPTSPRSEKPATEINIAIIGHDDVGKSTFIRRSLDLSSCSDDDVPSRVIAVAGSLYLVQMFEMTVDDIHVHERNGLSWPDSILNTPIHAATTVYDVSIKESFEDIPQLLNAMDQMSLPSALAACKCDLPSGEWELDPDAIEQKAKSKFRKVITLQTSESDNEGFRRGLSALLRTAVKSSQDRGVTYSGPRRCTVPTVSEQSSSRAADAGHARAASEHTGLIRNAMIQSRHDSSQTSHDIDAKAKATALVTRKEPPGSFLHLDESQTEDSATMSGGSVLETDDSEHETGQSTETIMPPSDENGWSFESLVGRLLALPTSKAHRKFAAIFLALYRMFAPPGQLLEAIVTRFEALDTSDIASMSRTVAQLRYLSIVEQWMRSYPGDFAHRTTLRRIRTFVTNVSNTSIFAAAALEMSSALELVSEDDDTDWACSDKDRVLSGQGDTFSTWSYRASTLLDDPDFGFPDEMGSLSLGRESKDTLSTATSSKHGMLHMVNAAQRQAQILVPIPRSPLGKLQWHALMEFTDEAIAKEMTRIDWTMFSSIRPRDLVRHVSLSPSQKATCKSLANVSRMIDHFNHIRNWVANYILIRDKPKHRAFMLEKLMRVARQVRDLNNYNSLGAILAGIQSSPIHRLAATRDLVSADSDRSDGPRPRQDWRKLEILMAPSRSFATYRLAWENSSSERIPYLPLPIRDLIGAEQGNKTFVGNESDGRINWRKFEVMGEVLVGIQRAQGLPYRSSVLGTRHDEITALLLHGKLVRDDDALHERSMHVEASANLGAGKSFREFFKR